MSWFSKIANIGRKVYRGAKGALHSGIQLGNKALNNPIFKTITDIARPILGSNPIGGAIFAGLDLARNALSKAGQVQTTIEKTENLATDVNEFRKNPSLEGFKDVFEKGKEVGTQLKERKGELQNLAHNFL